MELDKSEILFESLQSMEVDNLRDYQSDSDVDTIPDIDESGDVAKAAQDFVQPDDDEDKKIIHSKFEKGCGCKINHFTQLGEQQVYKLRPQIFGLTKDE